MNIFRRIREWIFGKRIEDCIGVTVGGTSPLVFDGCNDAVNIYESSRYFRPNLLVDADGDIHVSGSFSNGTKSGIMAIYKDGEWNGLDHVNDYSRPITYWDLKDKWRCSYCGSTNTDNDMECRKCGAPMRD